jgi:hypothetical protein
MRLFCGYVVLYAFRRADPQSEESFRLYKKDYGTEVETRAQEWAVEPLLNE